MKISRSASIVDRRKTHLTPVFTLKHLLVFHPSQGIIRGDHWESILYSADKKTVAFNCHCHFVVMLLRWQLADHVTIMSCNLIGWETAIVINHLCDIMHDFMRDSDKAVFDSTNFTCYFLQQWKNNIFYFKLFFKTNFVVVNVWICFPKHRGRLVIGGIIYITNIMLNRMW